MTRIKRILIFIFAILMLTAGMPTVAFATTNDTEKPVKVGYFAMENFMEGGADGSLQEGYTYELLCEIATYNHWNMEFVYGEFGDLYRQLCEGKIDILPNVISTEERKERVLFHPLLLNEEHYYISALATNVDPDEWSIDLLNGKRLATVRDAYEGVIFDKWAFENNISMEKVLCDGFDEAWELLDEGKADYILNINNIAPGPRFASLCAVGESGVHFAVAKDKAELLSDIDYALNMIDSVSPFLISNLQQKYLNEALSSYQLSEAEKNWLKGHSVLRIGGLKNDVPYAYEDASGNVVGAYVDLTKLILEKLSIDTLEVEWSLYTSMDELRRALKNGELDMICPEYHSHFEAMNNDFAISETVMNVPMGLITLGDVDINNMDSVATGATRPGLVYVRENFREVPLVTMDSVDEMVKAVVDKKVSGAIAHIYALQESISNHETEYKLSPLSIPCYICYASMQENNALVMMMNRGYHLISQAERNSIEVRSYGEKKSRLETARDFFRENMILIVLAILTVATIFIIAVNRSVYAQKLHRSLDEITKKNEIIEAAHEELTAANEAALKADRAKTSFLFNMSHDIRTPMNAIIGYTRLADVHADNASEVRGYLGKINQASNHLLSLIDDVLDMSRIESGKIQLEEKPENIGNAIDELNNIVQTDIDKKNIAFTKVSEIENKFVLCDKLRLARVLLNILSNSVKYTGEGGTIIETAKELTSDKPGYGRYEFTIKDNGIGMSKEFISTIFEPFTRAQSSTVSNIQGTGLGMAITKRLIDMMGGTIVIDSKEGVGTETTVTFDFVLANNSVQVKTEDVMYDFTGRKVLLVEDNEMNREIATELLEEAGFVVDIASDGTIAVEKVKSSGSGEYDLILMDIQMAIMDGYEATAQIRALENQKQANIIIIAMTANAFEEDKKNALDAGMNGHIAKPIDVRKLMDMLAAVFDS